VIAQTGFISLRTGQFGTAVKGVKKLFTGKQDVL
jgi:hypothetical protein